MAKYKAILNNYQIGSYPKHCLSQKIISEKRLDQYHTEVIWELNDSDYRILVRALGGESRIKKIE